MRHISVSAQPRWPECAGSRSALGAEVELLGERAVRHQQGCARTSETSAHDSRARQHHSIERATRRRQERALRVFADRPKARFSNKNLTFQIKRVDDTGLDLLTTIGGECLLSLRKPPF
eukprot:scaffold40832_cov63-Phaeocystis_antarctica.AAC.1